VGGSVVLADVRLELDDPANAAPGGSANRILAHETGTQERLGRLERRPAPQRVGEVQCTVT
jgi:hypothetical protein